MCAFNYQWSHDVSESSTSMAERVHQFCQQGGITLGEVQKMYPIVILIFPPNNKTYVSPIPARWHQKTQPKPAWWAVPCWSQASCVASSSLDSAPWSRRCRCGRACSEQLAPWAHCGACSWGLWRVKRVYRYWVGRFSEGSDGWMSVRILDK